MFIDAGRYVIAAITAGALALAFTQPAIAAQSKACASAQKKVAKEEQGLAGVQRSIDSKERAMPNCTTPLLCATFRNDLKALARLKTRHQTRIAKFKAAETKACASG